MREESGYDTIIRNGKVVDGTGRPAFKADVGLSNGRIGAVGNLSTANARKEIDASGKVVCPGFIDTHTHSDLLLLYDRQHANALQQGVTTEILGQDGMSYAPLSRSKLEMYYKYLAGVNGAPPVPLDWSSVWEFRDRFDGTVAINTAYQVPHGTLRLETLGFKNVPLEADALGRAKDMLRTGIAEGAVAMSTGLSYFPGAYSDTEELVELSKVLKEEDSVYVTHLRTVFKGEPFDAVSEALEIARRSGCRLHFSHFRTGPHNAGRVGELMRQIDEAASDGVDLTLELYPYSFGSSTGLIHLPPWAVEGGCEKALSRLRDPGLRQALVEGIEANTLPLDGVFTHLPSRNNDELLGKTFGQAAEMRGKSKAEVLIDLLVEEELAVGICGVPADSAKVRERLERDYLELLSRPYYMVGSDSILLGDNPHPRAFGTFPKLLRLCREHQFSLETMINRMTKVPARTFRLSDRGEIAEGKAADVVVFDPAEVRDTATIESSRSAPTGITHVWVNGVHALSNEKVTGRFGGSALPQR
mgnify:CR=1 FL=1